MPVPTAISFPFMQWSPAARPILRCNRWSRGGPTQVGAPRRKGAKPPRRQALRSLPLGVFALKKRVRVILSRGTKHLQAVAKNRGGNWATRCAKTYDRTFLRCRFVPRLAAANFIAMRGHPAVRPVSFDAHPMPLQKAQPLMILPRSNRGLQQLTAKMAVPAVRDRRRESWMSPDALPSLQFGSLEYPRSGRGIIR
jgi:hypothetical protein